MSYGIEPRSIRYFIAVAELLNFNSASERLHISQPALTKSIQKLEDHLQVTLFDRHPRGLELTPFGRVFLRHARSIQTGFDHALREIKHMRDATSDVIVIGAGPTWHADLLPAAVANIHEQFPSISVKVHFGFPEDLVPKVRTGHYDFAVSALSQNWLAEQNNPNFQNMDIVPLMDDDLCIIGREDHPIFEENDVQLSDLLNFPWVSGMSGSIQARLLAKLFARANLVAPHPLVESDDILFRLSTVARSDFLTFTSRRVYQSSSHSNLRIVSVPGGIYKRSGGLIRRKQSTLPPAALAFIAEIQKLCSAENSALEGAERSISS